MIIILRNAKSAFGAYWNPDDAAIKFLKQYFTGPVAVAVRVWEMLPDYRKFYHEGALQLYFAIVQFLFKRVIVDEKHSQARQKNGQPLLRRHGTGKIWAKFTNENIKL